MTSAEGDLPPKGKYALLAEWLRHQPPGPFEMSFTEIEELLGAALPPSSYQYPAHWHSAAGSRPGRAIREAGFRVRELDLVNERLVLERATSQARGTPPSHMPPAPAAPTAAPPVAAPTDLAAMPVPELLRQYARLMATLRDRGVLQTGNNPVSDYAEGLVARAFSLERTSGSAQGVDAVDLATGRRVQVKARRFSGKYRNVGMGFIRGLDADLFDELVAVIFAEDFSIHLAARLSQETVRSVAVWVPYVGAHQVRMTRAVLAVPGVDDITEDLRLAARTWR